jgi:hypothetical protein
MRRILERTLRQNPPPTFRALAARLEYKEMKVSARHFAGLSAELQARRKAFAKKHAARLSEDNCDGTPGCSPRRRWPRALDIRAAVIGPKNCNSRPFGQLRVSTPEFPSPLDTILVKMSSSRDEKSGL